MITTANQQTQLRTHPQSTELYLSVFRPRTAFAAMVTGTLSKGAREITYYSPTTGTYLSVEAGMTLLVGTSSGSRDLGKVRVRSATSSQLVVAENSHIDWSRATHLTVQRYWELWPVFPRIINDPSDDENVIFYKDYDVAYTNQNSILGTFPCAGPHRAIFAGESVYYTSSGTYNVLGESLTYDWAFEGGSVTGSASAVPGNVTYNTPGHYVTRLKVTSSSGAVDTTYRYISVYNNPNNSVSSLPIKNWSMDSLGGSQSEGGYSASFTITEEDITIYDGDVVVLFADDYYGNTNTSIGGNAPNASKIFFVGHIIGSSIRYSYRDSSVTFQVSSITGLMKTSEGFSISVESKPSPAKWFELLDMDSRRAIYHYLRWHTTALNIADFAFSGQDQKIQFFDADRESLYDAIDNYMRNTLLGTVVSDRQGKVWTEIGAWATSNPTGSFPSVMSLQNQDWVGSVSVEENLQPQVSYLELGGIAYSGVVTGTFEALISAAPGQTPHVRGTVDRNQGLALVGQTQLNELVGNVYANRNARFPKLGIDLNGNYRNFDIAPQESVAISATANETNIGIPIQATYIISGMSWNYSVQNKKLTAHIDIICLLNGTPGDTVTIPDIPDTGGYGADGFGGGVNFPPLALPPALSGLGNVFVLKASSPTLALPSANVEGQFDFTDIEINYNSSFSTYSGTADTGGSSSGTYVNYLTTPFTGIYLILMTVNHTLVNGTAYSNIIIKEPESLVWEDIDSRNYDDYNISRANFVTQNFTTKILPVGTAVGGVAASSSTFGPTRSASATISIILLARTE